MNERSAWPLACYPTFARILRQPETQSIEMTVLSSTGEIIPVEEDRLSQKFSTERWCGLVSHILRTKNFAQLSLRFKALWQVWAQNTSELQQADMIQFYKVTLIAIPERRNENPLKREINYHPQSGWFEDAPLRGALRQDALNRGPWRRMMPLGAAGARWSPRGPSREESP